MDYTYAYFTGILFLGLIWILIYLLRKDLRHEMIFGGVLGLPLGFTEAILVPDYWNPPSLFNFISQYGFGIESFLFAFFIGGLASIMYEFFNKRKTFKIKSDYRLHILPYGLMIILFLILQLLFPTLSIYNLIFACLIGAIIIGVKRKDLIPQIVLGGIFFASVYTVILWLTNYIYPGFNKLYFTRTFILKTVILGIPIQEIMIAFVGGACWSTFYEYIRGYKVVKIK